MSHTNETANFHLPQFTAMDKPDWLVDVNEAFQAIDAGMASTQSEAESASSVAQLAQTTAEGAAETAGQASSDVAGLTSDLETLQGTVNSITSLIGNGEPTTTDKTLIGAINELDSDIGNIGVTETTVGTYTLSANDYQEVTVDLSTVSHGRYVIDLQVNTSVGAQYVSVVRTAAANKFRIATSQAQTLQVIALVATY